MLHKFKIPVFEEGERSLKQECLSCGIPSIVYKPRSRFYYNKAGKITKNAPQCLEPRIIHNFEKIPIPEGKTEVIQTCLDCGKKSVVYASGSSRAYFDELTGARIKYTPACTRVNNAKIVSIREFVRANQVDPGVIEDNGKFIEAIFIIKYIQERGIDEHSTDMLNGFLDSLDEKALVETKAV